MVAKITSNDIPIGLQCFCFLKQFVSEFKDKVCDRPFYSPQCTFG